MSETNEPYGRWETHKCPYCEKPIIVIVKVYPDERTFNVELITSESFWGDKDE